MSQFQADTGYVPLAQVEAYWSALRKGALIPKRSDIDPRGIEQALEHTFIVERIAPGIARLRLAGSRLSDMMGMEVRGMPLTSFFMPDARREMSQLLEEVFQRPATARLTMTSSADSTRPEMPGRMVLLPLKSDLGDVSRILGCFVTKGEVGARPRRFNITSTDITQLGRAPEALIAEPRKVAEKLEGFGEPDRNFIPQSPRNRGLQDGSEVPAAPFLRLVKTDTLSDT